MNLYTLLIILNFYSLNITLTINVFLLQNFKEHNVAQWSRSIFEI